MTVVVVRTMIATRTRARNSTKESLRLYHGLHGPGYGILNLNPPFFACHDIVLCLLSQGKGEGGARQRGHLSKYEPAWISL